MCKLRVTAAPARCATLRGVTNPDRLSGLDASFLALEEGGAHMHVGSVLLFDGEAPAYEAFVAQLERRLALVPRYRQKLAFPPLVQSRPVWVDDPHFNPGYHVRHTALPEPAGEAELRRLAGRIFAQRLDRSKPLWELWLVDRVERRPLRDHQPRPTTASSTASPASTSPRCCSTSTPDPPEPPPAEPWVPRPEPTPADAARRRAGRARGGADRLRARRRRRRERTRRARSRPAPPRSAGSPRSRRPGSPARPPRR